MVFPSSAANAVVICAISRALRSVSDLNIRRVRNPQFSANDVDDCVAASEFLGEPGADVDVVFHKDAAVAPHSSLDDLLFRNADKAGVESKGPVTMVRQHKKIRLFAVLSANVAESFPIAYLFSIPVSRTSLSNTGIRMQTVLSSHLTA